jgi:hypothetical protein
MENALESAVDERDAAEQAMSQAYYLVTGRSPEWSNNFGYAQALEEISSAVAVLKNAARGEHRQRQRAEIAEASERQMREQVNAKYWEQIRAENVLLKRQLAELRAEQVADA